MEDTPSNIDEEKKLINVLRYMKKMADITISDDNLSNKRDRLVIVVNNLIPQLGITAKDNQNHEFSINEKLEDEMTNDLYESDPLYPHVIGYIQTSKNRYLLQEQISNVLCDFILDMFEMTNDILTSKRVPVTSNPLDTGEPAMTSEQREAMKKNAYNLAVYYKSSKDSVKRTILYKLNQLCDTNEKFVIANDLFQEVTGERVLEKYRQEEQSGSNTA